MRHAYVKDSILNSIKERHWDKKMTELNNTIVNGEVIGNEFITDSTRWTIPMKDITLLELDDLKRVGNDNYKKSKSVERHIQDLTEFKPMLLKSNQEKFSKMIKELQCSHESLILRRLSVKIKEDISKEMSSLVLQDIADEYNLNEEKTNIINDLSADFAKTFAMNIVLNTNPSINSEEEVLRLSHSIIATCRDMLNSFHREVMREVKQLQHRKDYAYVG